MKERNQSDRSLSTKPHHRAVGADRFVEFSVGVRVLQCKGASTRKCDQAERCDCGWEWHPRGAPGKRRNQCDP